MNLLIQKKKEFTEKMLLNLEALIVQTEKTWKGFNTMGENREVTFPWQNNRVFSLIFIIGNKQW